MRCPEWIGKSKLSFGVRHVRAQPVQSSPWPGAVAMLSNSRTSRCRLTNPQRLFIVLFKPFSMRSSGLGSLGSRRLLLARQRWRSGCSSSRSRGESSDLKTAFVFGAANFSTARRDSSSSACAARWKVASTSSHPSHTHGLPLGLTSLH